MCVQVFEGVNVDVVVTPLRLVRVTVIGVRICLGVLNNALAPKKGNINDRLKLQLSF